MHGVRGGGWGWLGLIYPNSKIIKGKIWSLFDVFSIFSNSWKYTRTSLRKCHKQWATLPGSSDLWRAQTWQDKIGQSSSRLMGNKTQFFSSVQETFIPHLCSRSTLPPVLDDIKNTQQLESWLWPISTAAEMGRVRGRWRPKPAP